jgi:hypothetical protein
MMIAGGVMFVPGIPLLPIREPRPKPPVHVPDAGGGLILLSIVVLSAAVIWKKLGFSKLSHTLSAR